LSAETFNLKNRRSVVSINKVILVGRLGADPELRYTSSGSPVCNFSVATSEKWTDETGDKQEKVEWHRIASWSKLAENCSKYLVKGREVYIEGRIQTRSYEDKDGLIKYITEVIAMKVEFLGSIEKESDKAA
jgi:single-strand DNA-binding protein